MLSRLRSCASSAATKSRASTSAGPCPRATSSAGSPTCRLQRRLARRNFPTRRETNVARGCADEDLALAWFHRPPVVGHIPVCERALCQLKTHVTRLAGLKVHAHELA